MNGSRLRADIVSGLTVALVLIPQSMAYAQLAGLPPYYGLYAAFLPPCVAAMFGSSHQLQTGPVAIVSMMTAAALEPLATAGSEGYIAYAILLALMIGFFQLSLGLMRLGMAVNFLSHPVVNGFTNAAAIIIATSQLSKIFGVYVDKAEHHYETIYRVIMSAIAYTHWPTLGMAVLAFATMYGLRRLNPKIPNVLVAVMITTILSWATGFKHDYETDLLMIQSSEIRETVRDYNACLTEMQEAAEKRTSLGSSVEKAEKTHGEHSAEAMELRHEVALLNLHLEELKEESQVYRVKLRSQHFEAVEDENGKKRFFAKGQLPAGAESDRMRCRLKV